MSAEVLVIGVGSPDRGDDGVGPVVAAEVARRSLPGVTVLAELTPLDLLDAWAGARTVVLVDAVRTGDPPGTVTTLDATVTRLPVGVGASSTHGLGLADVIEMSRSLGRVPERLVVVGVELADCSPGAVLSPRVRAAVGSAVETVLQAIAAGTAEGPSER